MDAISRHHGSTQYALHDVQRLILSHLPSEPRARFEVLQTWAQSRLQPFKERGRISADELHGTLDLLWHYRPPRQNAVELRNLTDNYEMVCAAFQQALAELSSLTPYHQHVAARPVPMFSRNRGIDRDGAEIFGDAGFEMRETRAPRRNVGGDWRAIFAPSSRRSPAHSDHSSIHSTPKTPPTRPQSYLHFTHIFEKLHVSNRNPIFLELWQDLCNQAEHAPKDRRNRVEVGLGGESVRMGFYRNHGRDGWCLHKKDFPQLKKTYEARYLAAHPHSRRHPKNLPPVLPETGFLNKSALARDFYVDHYHDPEFDGMWESLESKASGIPCGRDGTCEVMFQGKPVIMGYFLNGSRSSWYVAASSTRPLLDYIHAQRAERVPTATVAERAWFGPLQVATELGITRDHGGFRVTWAQIAAVGATLPSAGERARLRNEAGDLDVMRAGKGEKLVRVAISKESLPVFAHALERQKFIERTQWRANCSTDLSRDRKLQRSFSETWTELDRYCRAQENPEKLSDLTGVPSARAAFLLNENELASRLERVVSESKPRDTILGTLLDHVRDSHAVAHGHEVMLFSRQP